VEDAGSEATFRFDSIMFHHTCQLVAESLGTRKPLRIGFNVSGLTVCNPEWSRHVDKTLQRHPELTPYLGFEITETQSLNNFLVAERFCRTMRDAGSQVILDDCDAYAAPYLKRMIDAFGPGKIKVSRDGFVDHCKQPENSALRSICYLARAHNVPVVIEGIENRNQFDSVRDFNSVNQFFQGYMFGKPKIYPIPSVLPEADVAVHAPARTVIRARVHAHH
jgi:EAL domain-containing protein (putative c-di-GMP-specific phosphodiesterase class I)